MGTGKFEKWIDDPVVQLTVETSPHYQEVIRKTQEIRIDPGLCNPEACLKCLQVCSPKVFGLYPGVNLWTGEQVHPPKIQAFMPELCTLCGRCVEECPQKAVSIVLGSEREG